ncbi:MAG: YceI family protein [Bdellovibrionaceae bacterium]|nr:YceI family protein [Bdellovibrio sp.]
MNSRLSKTILTAIMLVSLSALAQKELEAGKYNIDPMHSKIGFEVPHLVISSVDGTFKKFSGTFTIDEKFENSKLDAEAQIDSIDTGVEKRDTHLKSPDFFDAKQFPKMTFKSTALSGKPESFKLIGDLTIKGKTKKVTFDTKYTGSAVDGYGNLKAAFIGTAKISRKEFGLNWSQAVEVGPIVGDEITIELKIQGAQEKAAKK